jgi:hypothetical protein
MVEMIFRPLVDRLIDMKNEIKNDENLVNYTTKTIIYKLI